MIKIALTGLCGVVYTVFRKVMNLVHSFEPAGPGSKTR